MESLLNNSFVNFRTRISPVLEQQLQLSLTLKLLHELKNIFMSTGATNGWLLFNLCSAPYSNDPSENATIPNLAELVIISFEYKLSANSISL